MPIAQTIAITPSTLAELDNPIWHALSGPQAELGTVGACAGFYDPQVAPFAAFQEPTPQAFAELARLTGPARTVAFFTVQALAVPDAWQILRAETLEQMVCAQLQERQFDDAVTVVELRQADIPDMLALTAATEPGPFGPQTLRCGRYLGIRAADNGALVAMTGERLRLRSALEISAVCTAASHRGQGLAARLVHQVAAHTLSRGLLPFLHVRTANTSARALYETLGFVQRRTSHLTVVSSPA